MGLLSLWVIKTNCDEISTVKVCGLICVSLRVLDEEKCENHQTQNMGLDGWSIHILNKDVSHDCQKLRQSKMQMTMRINVGQPEK